MVDHVALGQWLAQNIGLILIAAGFGGLCALAFILTGVWIAVKDTVRAVDGIRQSRAEHTRRRREPVNGERVCVQPCYCDPCLDSRPIEAALRDGGVS